MLAENSIEILQKLIKEPPQGKEGEVVAAQYFLNEYTSAHKYLDTFDIEQQLQITLLNIDALSCFVQGYDRNQVLQKISAKPWIEQHEILTRWAWMNYQGIEKRKGKVFNHLYLCKVGSKIKRETLDREFATLIWFLPYFHKHTKEEYLFCKKLQYPEEPPDFVVIDKHERKLGIEITEAPSNQGKAGKDAEELIAKLEEDFKQQAYNLTIRSRPEWKKLLDNYDKLKNEINNLILHTPLQKSEEIKCFKIPDLELNIALSWSKNGFSVFDMSGEGSGTAYARDEVVTKIRKAVCEALCKKFKKEPKIKPSILVIYENTSSIGVSSTDYKQVANFIAANSIFQQQNFYAQVWLIDEQKGICILENP